MEKTLDLNFNEKMMKIMEMSFSTAATTLI